MYEVHNILVPTDFSEPAREAFAIAGALALDHSARVVVLHVLESGMPFGEFGVVVEFSDETIPRLEERLAAEYEVADPRVRLERMVRRGEVVAEILRAAEELRADLIVMGTHGRRGIDRVLMGSVAEQVLRRAPCPVLIARPHVLKDEAAAIAAPTGREPIS